jgi:SAM-dependent methyltransferase
MTEESSITAIIRQKYGAAARSGIDQHTAGVKELAQAIGYTTEELEQLPSEANMGLGCGNPTALAGLQKGEIVVDLGCGAGIDVFLAARRVGPTGRAIGIDMTPEMLERALNNAARIGLTNVEFLLGQLEKLPLPDAYVDCVISNCVINLVPDKATVFGEIYRVLRPAGRIAISDIALVRPLPAELAGNLEAVVGCIAGAIMIEDYARLLKEAGFVDIEMAKTGVDLQVYTLIDGQSACCSPAMHARSDLQVSVTNACCCPPETPQTSTQPIISAANPLDASSPIHSTLAQLQQKYNLNDYAVSVRISARKPVKD